MAFLKHELMEYNLYQKDRSCYRSLLPETSSSSYDLNQKYVRSIYIRCLKSVIVQMCI